MKKLEIIETSEYYLAVSDDKIKNYYTYYYDLIKGVVVKYMADSSCEYKKHEKKIIAHLPKGNAPELDLLLLPEMIVEDDVEKLTSFHYGENRSTREFEEGFRKGFKIGYKAATKVHTEEDVRNAFQAGMEFIAVDPNKYHEDVDEYIQSLKQPKTPKWFVAQIEDKFIDGYDPYIGEFINVGKLKTTTINGKTYLVGTYKFE